MDPLENLKFARSTKGFKVVEFGIPWSTGGLLLDLSCAARGNGEDELFLNNPDSLNIVRRGNTVVRFTEGTETKTAMGRKGLMKFFDFSLDFFADPEGDKNKKASGKFSKWSEMLKCRDVIWNPVEGSLAQKGNSVILYKLVKANGENCQVSYLKDLDSWVVASKNVGLAARTREDLDLYRTKDRFGFALLMAETWFDIVDGVSKNGHLQDLKDTLDQHAFIGEYVGNQNHQHLVRYTKIDIVFYAVVDKYSDLTCIPPRDGYALLNKYGLSTVGMEEVGTFSTKPELETAVSDLFKRIAAAPINEEEEGSVLYFVQKAADDTHHVLSLSKLKTLEYRLLRKLREKLKSHLDGLSHGKSTTNKFAQFKREAQDLIEDFELPKPLDYYFQVAETAFTYAEKNVKNLDYIRERYIDFLENALKSQAEIGEIDFKTAAVLEGSNTLSINQEANQKEAPKMDEAPKNTKTQYKNDFEEDDGRKELYVFVPVSIPGTGKTTTLNALEKSLKSEDINFQMISSDAIRLQCIKEKMRKDKNLDKDTAFSQTAKTARTQFLNGLERMVKSASSCKQQRTVIFMDKNHPPNGIPGAMRDLKRFCPGNVRMKIIAIVPESSPFTVSREEGRGITYPFSLSCLMQCCLRVKNRKDHETLNGEENSSNFAKVVFMFYNMFRGVDVSEKSMEQNGFDHTSYMPFTQETDNDFVSEELFAHIQDILRNSPTSHPYDNDKAFDTFVQFLEAEAASFKFENTEQACVERVKSELELLFGSTTPSLSRDNSKKGKNKKNSKTTDDSEETKRNEKSKWKKKGSEPAGEEESKKSVEKKPVQGEGKKWHTIRIKKLEVNNVIARFNVLHNETLRLNDMAEIPSITDEEVKER